MRRGIAIATPLVAAVALPACGGAPVQRSAPAPSPAAHAEHPSIAAAGRRPVAAPDGTARRAGGSPRRRSTGAANPPPARRAAPGRPAVLPSTLLRAFPILERPGGSGDRPAGQARALLATESRERRRLGEGALLIADARRLPGTPGSWLVPAPGALCLLRPVRPGAAGPAAFECVHAAAALCGYLMSSISGLPGASERSALEGVLPAGAAHAVLELADGQRLAIALHAGGYAVSESGATALRFERAGRELTVPVPQAPAGSAP